MSGWDSMDVTRAGYGRPGDRMSQRQLEMAAIGEEDDLLRSGSSAPIAQARTWQQYAESRAGRLVFGGVFVALIVIALIVLGAIGAGSNAAPRNPYDTGGALESGALTTSCSVQAERDSCGTRTMRQAACEAAGCCWRPATTAGAPWCFHPNGQAARAPGDTHAHYVVSGRSASGASLSLVPDHGGAEGTGTAEASGFKRLRVETHYISADVIHVRIVPEGGSTPRWEVPESVFLRPAHLAVPPDNPAIAVELPAEGQPFGLKVIRPGQAWAPLFDTTGLPLVYEDQYLELSTHMPENSQMMGLGEATLRGGPLLMRDGQVITLWNADIPAATPDSNLYGSHPVYIEMRPDGQTHGVHLLNSNGMDIELRRKSVTYRVIGGVLDFYFFAGPSPEQIADDVAALRAMVESQKQQIEALTGMLQTSVTSPARPAAAAAAPVASAAGAPAGARPAAAGAVRAAPARSRAMRGLPAVAAAAQRRHSFVATFSMEDATAFAACHDHEDRHVIEYLSCIDDEETVEVAAVAARQFAAAAATGVSLPVCMAESIATMQYHTIIGRPSMPPRWALGFHQCRWGYENVTALEEVVASLLLP
ncbi:hypothetical protein FOA52_007219 [Chlamydomonas sp. UWO 241]|nr:hypothetical protein FOA52_007219 [Chlamydomonas sp. UWO 241]